ncbi:hypothetical protein DC522_10255 [Microvirga sp. KLBC 81]|uniref:hypothetical protein n=1 Tax=Microvirga sp. KLBC 81 TaxID=1862707 RepID=UPI000D5163A3|nr:hypothetical protein [Microvirga sp. KLBC 81]PVE24465.1 hypothetical protein DC522_10255 [Microvirga sp. KLBC 81]
MQGHRTFEWAVAALVAAAGLVGLVLCWPIVFPLDDAYITLHNARVLLEGVDRGFGVPALVGATSPVHLALVAGLGLILDLPLASYLLNLAATILYGVGLARLAFWVQPSRRIAAGLVALGLSAAHVPYHLFNGLETGLAMAAVTWALVLALSGSRFLLPLLCGLMPFIRPELAVPAGALLVWRTWKQRNTMDRIAVDFALAALTAAPWLLWSWIATGSVTPLTASAKRAFFAEELYPFWFKLKIALIFTVQSGVGAFLLAALFVRRMSIGVPVLLSLVVILLMFAVTFPGGLFHNFYRYCYPLLPIGLLGWGIATRDSRGMRWAFGALAAIYVVIGFNTWPHVAGGRRFTAELDEAARWSREHLPAGARILIHDAGYFAWATPFALFDIVGLKTPSSIADHRRWTLPSRAQERHVAVHEIARRSRVSHAVILNDEFWGDLADDLRRHGWGLRPLREPPSHGYVVYELTPPAS